MVILGVSPDTESSHQKFITDHRIPFPGKKVMEAYGAFGEKKMYGKLGKGVIRSTVWVGPDGTVRKHWARVAKAADHPANVLKVLQSSL